MRLSRPVAAVLLVLVVLLLVWLMLGQGGAGEDPGADAPRLRRGWHHRPVAQS